MESLGFSGHVEATDAGSAAARGRASASAEGDQSVLAKRLAGLAGVVKDEVVPRLLETHRAVTNEPAWSKAELAQPEPGVVDELADLAIKDGAAARARVQALHDEGLPIEAIYLNVLAPTARLLGKMWETDHRHFAEVTVGVGRLQQMLHDFEAAFQRDAKAWQPSLGVLLMPAPHEQHTFGLFMIGEFMRRAGWDAWTGPLPPDRELRRLIKSGDFGVIGFSASANCRLDELTDVITEVRRIAGDRPLCIMVGGGLFVADPSLVEKVGADGTAVDARSTIRLAHQLLGERIQHP